MCLCNSNSDKSSFLTYFRIVCNTKYNDNSYRCISRSEWGSSRIEGNRSPSADLPGPLPRCSATCRDSHPGWEGMRPQLGTLIKLAFANSATCCIGDPVALRNIKNSVAATISNRVISLYSHPTKHCEY